MLGVVGINANVVTYYLYLLRFYTVHTGLLSVSKLASGGGGSVACYPTGRS